MAGSTLWPKARQVAPGLFLTFAILLLFTALGSAYSIAVSDLVSQSVKFLVFVDGDGYLECAVDPDSVSYTEKAILEYDTGSGVTTKNSDITAEVTNLPDGISLGVEVEWVGTAPSGGGSLSGGTIALSVTPAILISNIDPDVGSGSGNDLNLTYEMGISDKSLLIAGTYPSITVIYTLAEQL